jgi:dsDNA-specific endonuclease/ATPase MutS2
MAFSPQERAEAISKGAKKYFTGRACKSGHVAERRTSNGNCVVCEAEKHRRWAESNPEKMKQVLVKSQTKHGEKRRQKAAEYRAKNPETIRVACAKSKKKHRAYHTYLESQRQQRIKQATPTWLTDSDKEWMVNIYKQSQHLKSQHGVVTAVDHIVPIRGENVCGLNVPWNLRVTTQKYNSAKCNNLEENLPIYQSQGSIMIHKSVLPWTLRS